MTLRVCDRISEQIHLLVDHELGPAEESVVERHLHECPRCLAVATRIEAMSSILKEWEAHTYEHIANDHSLPLMRMRNAVLARVAEQSATRRREDRMLKLIHYATAACILVALGLGIGFGLSAGDPAAPEGPTYEADTGPTPLEERMDRVPVLAPLQVSEQLAQLDLHDPRHYEPIETPELVSPLLTDEQIVRLDGEAVSSELPRLARRVRRVVDFSQKLGMPGMAIMLPRAEGHVVRYMSKEHYRFLFKHKHVQEWALAHGPIKSSTIEGGRPPTSLAHETDRVARELLEPMPGLRTSEGTFPSVREILDRPVLSRQAPPVPSGSAAKVRPATPSLNRPYVLEALGIRAPKPAKPGQGLESGPAGSRRSSLQRRFIDPLVANSNERGGLLELVEGAHGSDSVLAFVNGTAMPIFIPAGQLLSGGRADRVVAQPVWLPPSKGRSQPYEIPCRVVENLPDGDRGAAVRVTEFIAGPTIRALLAAGASQVEVKEAAQRQIQASRGNQRSFEFWGNWSLLDLYGGPWVRARINQIHGATRWHGNAGFVALDAQGRLVGIEVLRLEGPQAELLLSRLWTGYTIEARLRALGASSDAVAAPGESLEHAMRRISTSTSRFQTPKDFRQHDGAVVSALELANVGVHLHAIEVGDKPAMVSVLSSATR